MAKTRGDGGGKGRKKGGGIDLPKFAGEVSRNFARGVKKASAGLDTAIPLSSRKSKTISTAMKNAPKARAKLGKYR
jgi:hypothetical protein